MNKVSLLISTSHTYIYKSSYLIILIILLEYIQLFDETINSINRIVNQGADTNFITAVSYINPVHFLKQAQTCTQYNGYNICKFPNILIPYIFILLVLALQIYSYFLLVRSKKKKEGSSIVDSKMNKNNLIDKIMKMLEAFYVNYFDLMVHLFSYTIFYFFSNMVINTLYGFYFTSISLDIPYLILAILAILALSYFLYFSTIYIKSFVLMIQFDKKISLHYDHLFSRNYDYFLLFYKLMIVLFNNFSSIAERQNSYILDSIISFLPLTFIIYLAIKLYTNKILFLINKRYNATRIFLLTFNSIFSISFISFNNEFQNTVSLIIDIIACFCLSLRITYYFIEKNKSKIIEGKNLIHQFAYIISARNIEDSNLESEVFKLVLTHKINCEKNYKRPLEDDSSSLCHICNEQNFTIDNFIRNFYAESKIRIEKDNYIQADLEIYELLKLFTLLCFESTKKIELMITVVRMLSTKNNKNYQLNSNVLLFYDFFIENNNSYDGKFYNILNTYEETSGLLDKTIDLALSIYEYEEIGVDFHIKAEEILLLRNKIKQNFSNFSKYKDIRCDNFSLVIFQKIYESLFNTTIEEYALNLADTEIKQIIENSYENDKFIYINYNLQLETLRVTNVSKDLSYIKHKNLEEYFPQEISFDYKNQFIEKLRFNESDSFTFKFLIKEKSANFLIKKVIMKCKIFQSTDSTDLKIVGTYEIKENSFVILEKDENDPSCSYIRNSSLNIAKLLYLPDVFIKYPYNVHLNFFRIFKEKNLVHFPSKDLTKKEKSKKRIIEINYSSHYALMSTLVSALQGYENNVEENMKKLEEKAERKVIKRLNMKEIQSFKSEKATYLLLSLTTKKDQKSIENLHKYYDNEKQDIRNEDNNSLDLTKLREESMQSLFDSKNNISSTTSSITSIASKQTSIKSQKIEKFKQSMSISSNLGLLNVFTIILVSFLILYNIIILVINTKNNSDMMVTNGIRLDFLTLKTNFFSAYNTVFNSLYIYNDNQTEVLESYNSYYQSYSTDSNNTFNFLQIMNEELLSKLDFLQTMIHLLQGSYYSSFASQNFEAIFNAEMEYYSITSTNGFYQLQNKNISMYDSIQTFMNLAKIISTREENWLFVYIIDFKDGIYDFSNINGRVLDNNQIYAMELVLNFVNYYKMLGNVEIQVNDYYYNKIDYNNKVFLYFTLSLEAIHVVFLFFCILQVNSISGILDQFTFFISKLMKDHKITIMKEKFKILKNLNDLYREHPRKYLKLLKEIKGEDSEKNKLSKKSTKNSSVQEEKENEILSFSNYLKTNKRLQIAKKAILLPLIIFIVTIFSLFYVFSLIFQIATLGTSKDFQLQIDINRRMLNNMNNIINNYNLAHINFLTNNTDNSLYNIITANGTSGTFPQPHYIRGIIDIITSETISTVTLIKNAQSYSAIAFDQGASINCTSIYNLVNDALIMGLNQSNPSRNYSIIEYFTDMCTGSYVYNNGKDHLVNEINYRLNNYLFYYEEQNFNLADVVKVYNQPTFTELYIAVDMIFRPLQTYILSSVVPILNYSANTHSTITTIFNIANILIDLIILFLVVRRLRNKSTIMRQYLYNILEVMIEA